MTKRFSVVILALMLGVSALYAGKGKVRIASDHQGAYVYVDGKKKAMTGEGFTSILLEEGEYMVKVVKSLDVNFDYTQSKQVFVGGDTSTKLTFTLKKEMTAKGKAAENAKNERWQRSGNIITDTKLGLLWQDNPAAKSTEKKWKSAKKYCKSLSLDGYSDWRLPSYDELLSIVDYDRHSPAIIPSFRNIVYGYYWSASQDVSHAQRAWCVAFDHGGTNSSTKSNDWYNVRCVRHRQ